LLLAAAACQPTEEKTDQPAATANAPKPEAPKSPAAELSGEYKIGFNYEETGNAATFGVSSHKGSELALKEINESGALGGLMAWDLTDFMRRLRFAAGQGTPKQYDELKSLERRHLARLTVIALAGLLLASMAMLVRLEFTFEWVVLLTLVTVLGVTQLVAWLRRRE